MATARVCELCSLLAIFILAGLLHRVKVGMWVQWRIKSVCISAKSEQSKFLSWRNIGPMATHRACIKYSDQTAWMSRLTESSMGAHDNVYLLLDTCLFVIILLIMIKLIMMVVLPANCCIQKTRTVPRPFFHWHKIYLKPKCSPWVVEEHRDILNCT